MVTIKKSTLIAAYLVATAYCMGYASIWNQYACPGETGGQTVIFTMMTGLAWPFAVGATVLGWTGHAHCLDGALTRSPHQND